MFEKQFAPTLGRQPNVDKKLIEVITRTVNSRLELN